MYLHRENTLLVPSLSHMTESPVNHKKNSRQEIGLLMQSIVCTNILLVLLGLLSYNAVLETKRSLELQQGQFSGQSKLRLLRLTAQYEEKQSSSPFRYYQLKYARKIMSSLGIKLSTSKAERNPDTGYEFLRDLWVKNHTRPISNPAGYTYQTYRWKM